MLANLRPTWPIRRSVISSLKQNSFAAENAIVAHRRQRSRMTNDLGNSRGRCRRRFCRRRPIRNRSRTVSGPRPNDANPMAVMEDRPLSNTIGAVLDPVFSLRRRVRIQPNQSVRCSFSTAVARSREASATARRQVSRSHTSLNANSGWPGPRLRLR